jgi:hypothetical protein
MGIKSLYNWLNFSSEVNGLPVCECNVWLAKPRVSCVAWAIEVNRVGDPCNWGYGLPCPEQMFIQHILCFFRPIHVGCLVTCCWFVISEVVRSQKCYMNLSPVLSGYGAMDGS